MTKMMETVWCTGCQESGMDNNDQDDGDCLVPLLVVSRF